MAGFGALPQTVISLRVKKTLLIKPSKLKLMVYIGSQNEVVFPFYQFQQVGIGLTGTHIIAIYHDLTGPPCPIFLRRIIGIETAGVHIADSILLVKVRKVVFKPFPVIGHSRRGRHSRARADYNGIRRF